MAIRGEAEKRVNGSQAGVAAGHTVVPVRFEMIEEPADQLAVEVGDVEVAGVFAGLLVGEGEQQPKRVPVRVHGVRAGSALAVQAGEEEGLESGGERAHCCWLRRRWARTAAALSSSGTAEKYQ